MYVGLVKGEISISDPEFHKRELTLMGSRNATREDFAVVKHAMENGLADVQRYVTHHLSFDHMVDDFDGITKLEANVMKAIIEV